MRESMQLLLFICAHFGFMILVGLVGYIIGLRITRRIPYHSLLEEISVCVSLGLGVIAYIVFLLGLLGLLYPSVVLLAITVCVAACYQVIRSSARRVLSALKGRWPRSKLIVSGLLLVLSVPILILPLYPPTAFDETMYFLTTAKVFAQNHGIIFTPYLRFPVLTQLNEMLFTLGILLYDDIAVHLIQLLMLIMLVAAVVAFCGRYFSKRAGWWSAAILLANRLVAWAGSVAYVDIMLMLYVAMASYTFFNWIRTRGGYWLILSGVFCGLAAGTKYPGLVFPLFFGLVAIYVAVRDRKYSVPFRFAAVALAVAAPWYIRNFYYTGNPVFPFLPEIFGYSFWTAEDFQGLTAEMRSHGIGQSLANLITIPWHLAFNQAAFFEVHGLSMLYFFALPVVVISVFKDARIRAIMILVAFFTLFWFFSAQILRYLLPIIPMLSIAVGASLDLVLARVPLLRKWSQHKAVIALIFAFLIFEGWLYAVRSWRAHGPVPVTQQQREQYLTQRLPSYPMYKLMNDVSGQSYKLYSVFDENMAYYVDGVYMGDYFGPAGYMRIFSKLSDGQALYDELKSLGIDYFLVNNRRSSVLLPQDSFFRENFKLIYSRGNALLFDLKGGSLTRDSGPQLLKNPGFEDVIAGWPIGWAHAGSPVVDTTGQNSHTGLSAVRCAGSNNIFYQVVKIKPGKQYLLSFQLRGVADGQKARIQANWSDAQGKLISTDLQVIEVGTDWRPCTSTVTPPEQAAYVVIYASCHDNGSAWFDDFSFTETQLLLK